MTQDVNINDVLAFLVEIGTLALLGTWAWHIAPTALWARLVSVVAVVGLAMVLWGLFAAPQAAFDVPALALLVKVLVLGGGVLAAYALASGLTLPTVWAVVVVVNTTLVYVGPFAR